MAMARRTSATEAQPTVPTSARVYGLNTSLERSVTTRAPPMRSPSRLTAAPCEVSVPVRPAALLDMIESPVEGVEVAPAALLVETCDRAIHDERDALFGQAAVRAQRCIEPGEIMLRRGTPEHDRPLGNDHQVPDAIGRQLEAPCGLRTSEHQL